MLDHLSAAEDAGLEQCVDELDGFIGTLADYAESTLAFALRVHLGALLRAMVDQHVCSREDVREFLVGLERESLGVGAQ